MRYARSIAVSVLIAGVLLRVAAAAQTQPGAMHGIAQVQRVDVEHHSIELLLYGRSRSVRMTPGRGGAPQKAPPQFDTSQLVPLPDLGTSTYQGIEGGLYPGGRNEASAEHERAGAALARDVQARDPSGNPDPGGRIVLMSIGMSNTVQAFDGFMRAAKEDTRLNPHLLLVNAAHGGVTARAMRDPNDGGTGTAYWTSVDQRLREAGATRAQVQAIWIKQADANPAEDFQTYTSTLESELGDIVRTTAARFPLARLVYLSSRTYGGYATTTLNPEPYAYWSGFAVKQVIASQLAGDPSLNFDPTRGPIKAPWLSWGPYLWSKAFTQSDFAPDGTHESAAGQAKVGRMLLDFFSTDSTTKPWFLAPQSR